jgi:hypothetical protein
MARQLQNTTHEARRAQITNALAELDRRIAETQAALGA